MTLDFSQNKMKVIFEITEEKQVALKEFCVDSYTAEHEKNLRRCAIAEVQISGENPDDHHGAKHTGTWGGKSLKYCLHKYYTPEFVPFYPLGLNSYQDDFICVGYKAKYLAVWKMNSEDNYVFIPLQNVVTANVLYPTDSKCKFDIKESGLEVTLPDKFSAVILRLT